MPHCQAQLWGLLCSCLLGWVGVGGQLHRYSSTHSDAASVVPMSPSSLMSILLTINGPISMIPSVHLHILVSTCRHIYHTRKKCKQVQRGCHACAGIRIQPGSSRSQGFAILALDPHSVHLELPAPVDLQSTIDEILHLLQASLEKHGTQLL